VNYLAGKMREGLFIQTDVAYGRLPDGRSAIVDGQHGLAACRQTGIPINVSICGYTCKDEAELWALYSEHDQGLRRTQADIVRASRSIMPPEVRDIPHSKVSLYGAAILMAPSSSGAAIFLSRTIRPKRRVMAVFASPAEALFLHEYQHVAIFNRIPVHMAMLSTHRVDEDRARLFWKNVVDIKRLPEGDPRRVLHRFLAESRRGASSAVRVRAIYSYCVGCWNAHVTGGSLNDCIRDAMQGAANAMKPTTATTAANLSGPATVKAQAFPATSTNPIRSVTPMPSVPAPAASA